MIIHKPQLLATTLGYPIDELKTIAESLKGGARKYYYSYVDRKIKNGKVKERPIDPSRSNLKDIQNKIKSAILSSINLPKHIQGSAKGRSNINNAKHHRSKPYQFQTDLTKFFQFVSSKMVFNALREHGYSPDVAYLLTQLTTYKGHLPQGAPTSPILANLVGLSFDKHILELCADNNIFYTRYVDDLWFSSEKNFEHLIPTFLQIILDNGFIYSHAKTVSKKGKIEGTGCLIKTNGSMTITKKIQAKLDNPDLKPDSRKAIEKYKWRVENS